MPIPLSCSASPQMRPQVFHSHPTLTQATALLSPGGPPRTVSPPTHTPLRMPSTAFRGCRLVVPLGTPHA